MCKTLCRVVDRCRDIAKELLSGSEWLLGYWPVIDWPYNNLKVKKKKKKSGCIMFKKIHFIHGIPSSSPKRNHYISTGNANSCVRKLINFNRNSHDREYRLSMTILHRVT